MNQNVVQDRADPLHATMHGILAHPACDAAVLHYLDRTLAWRRQMGLFNRVANSAGLYAIGYVLFLHFGNRNGPPEQGATFSRLLAISESRGNCGPRALRTILTLAHVMGFLEVTRARGDRRIQIYTPTEKLVAQTRGQNATTCECLDMLVPDADFARQERSGPIEFAANLYATGGKAFLDHDIKITEYFPDMDALIQMHAGCPTLLSVANAHMRGIACPSPSAIAKEFHVSASQVRTLQKAAADRGLLRISERGQVLDADLMVKQQNAMFAREMALYAKYSFGLEAYFSGFGASGLRREDPAENRQLRSVS
jgi:hypothetical protein